MILFQCKCGEELEAAEDEAGQVLMCPICKAKVLVPRRNENIEAGNPVTVPASPVVHGAEQRTEAMQCPFCQTVMQQGKATIERADFGALLEFFLIIRTAPKHLYFRQSAEGQPVYVDSAGQAFYCLSCRAFLLAGPEPEAPSVPQQEQGQKDAPVLDLPRYPENY